VTVFFRPRIEWSTAWPADSALAGEQQGERRPSHAAADQPLQDRHLGERGEVHECTEIEANRLAPIELPPTRLLIQAEGSALRDLGDQAAGRPPLRQPSNSGTICLV